MNTLTQSPDYFFAIEGSRGETALWAAGAGMEVVRSLARLAIRDQALRDEPLLAAQGLTAELDTRTLFGTSDLSEAKAVTIFEYTYILTRVMKRDANDSLRDRKHKKALIDQIRSGSRSVQSVIDESNQIRTDRRRVNQAGSHWFDEGGRQVISPVDRSDAEELERLKLQTDDPAPLKLTPFKRGRNESDEVLAAKVAVRATLPKGAKPRTLEVAVFNRQRDGSIHPRKPVGPKGILWQTVYGYVYKGEFVPVGNPVQR